MNENELITIRKKEKNLSTLCSGSSISFHFVKAFQSLSPQLSSYSSQSMWTHATYCLVGTDTAEPPVVKKPSSLSNESSFSVTLPPSVHRPSDWLCVVTRTILSMRGLLILNVVFSGYVYVIAVLAFDTQPWQETRKKQTVQNQIPLDPLSYESISLTSPHLPPHTPPQLPLPTLLRLHSA